MGKELAEKYAVARAIFEEADKALGFPISNMCFAGSEEDLKQTANTQPAILALSPAVVADACKRAAENEVCTPANLNSPEQTVISGHAGAVKRAVEIASQLGAKRAVILPVSAPFHCALMTPAQEKLAQDLHKTPFSDLRVALVTNVDADTETTGAEAKDALVRQVSMPVRWEESVRVLIDEGVNTFVEVGPGRVLTGLLRQIERSVAALNIEDEKSLATTLDKIGGAKFDAA